MSLACLRNWVKSSRVLSYLVYLNFKVKIEKDKTRFYSRPAVNDVKKILTKNKDSTWPKQTLDPKLAKWTQFLQTPTITIPNHAAQRLAKTVKLSSTYFGWGENVERLFSDISNCTIKLCRLEHWQTSSNTNVKSMFILVVQKSVGQFKKYN